MSNQLQHPREGAWNLETWQLIVTVCAGIITLFTFWEKLWKYIRPVAEASDDHKMTKEHHLRIAKIEEHQANDLKALQDLARANRVVCSALLALLDHQLSGNHTEQLEEAKKQIQSYLIER